jgi:Sec-independent protein translocase protein TatA
MFGLGFWEIILILLAAIIFIRPDDLPVFLRKLGSLYKSLMDMHREVTKMVNEPMDMISKESGESANADDASSKNSSKNSPESGSTAVSRNHRRGAPNARLKH